MSELKEFVGRVADIRHSRPSGNTRQRVQEAAQELSRAGDVQMRVELANEALAALCVVLYELDADQRPANIDPVTWRILLPTPWGRAGWRQWGLRRWEAEVLRRVLRIRTEMRKHKNLFDYNEQGRTWHLNRADYPTVEQALAYLKGSPITLIEWRKHADVIAEQARTRMQRLRLNAG